MSIIPLEHDPRPGPAEHASDTNTRSLERVDGGSSGGGIAPLMETHSVRPISFKGGEKTSTPGPHSDFHEGLFLIFVLSFSKLASMDMFYPQLHNPRFSC